MNRFAINSLTIRGCIFLALLLLGLELNAQRKPFQKQSDLWQLLDDSNLNQVRSGLLTTGVRNDTLFALFYLSVLNEIRAVPVIDLQKKESVINYSSPDLFLFPENRASIVNSCLRYYETESEGTVFIIQQFMIWPNDIRRPKIEECKKYRVLFYSTKKGIYDCKYLPVKDACKYYELEWLYSEGDFYF